MIKHIRTHKRPGFRANAEQGAFKKHNLSEHTFKIKNFQKPALTSINGTMPHRMAWKHIRNNTLDYYNREESKKGFKRWTDRFLSAGVEKIGETKQEIQDLTTAIGLLANSTNLIDVQKKAELEERKRILTSMLTNQEVSQNVFTRSRTELIDTVEDYAKARRKRRRYVNKGKHVPSSVRKDVKKARVKSITALRDFMAEANSFHANVPDLGPHLGVNNPVNERTHLNFRESRSRIRLDKTTGRNLERSPSPMSRRVLEHSPERIGKVAIESTGAIISVTGATIPLSTLSNDTLKRIKVHGKAKVVGYDPSFTFGV